MLLGGIFKRYQQRVDKILLIKEVIERLNIDAKQKQLYVDSLELLDDEEYLDIFYKKLTALIEILEEKDIVENQEIIKDKIKKNRLEEQQENMNQYHLLLDNI